MPDNSHTFSNKATPLPNKAMPLNSATSCEAVGGRFHTNHHTEQDRWSVSVLRTLKTKVCVCVSMRLCQLCLVTSGFLWYTTFHTWLKICIPFCWGITSFWLCQFTQSNQKSPPVLLRVQKCWLILLLDACLWSGLAPGWRRSVGPSVGAWVGGSQTSHPGLPAT